MKVETSPYISLCSPIKSGQNAIILCLLKLSLQNTRTKVTDIKQQRRYIKALVVGEAHLIEAWGIDFRDDFQTLGAFRERLINSSPENKALRNIFISNHCSIAKSTLEMILIMEK